MSDTTTTIEYQPKCILLTGGAGFIGSNTLIHLVVKYPNYKFICLDRLEPCASKLNLSEIEQCKNFVFVQGDILDYNLVYKLFQQHQVDTVMHFAAESSVDNSFGNSIHFTETNVKGTHVLLEATRAINNQQTEQQIKRFIHVSTDEVYGETLGDDIELKEKTSHLSPNNPYSSSKVGAEFIVKSYGCSYKLPWIITRGNNVYGIRQFPEKMIPKFITLLSQGKKCSIHGTGKNRRSFLHVDDVARAFDVILHRGKLGEIYNIGTHQEYENIEVLEKLITLFKQHYPELLAPDGNYVEFVRDRAFNDFRYRISTLALEELGWKLENSDFDEWLLKTIQWYLANPNHWSLCSIAKALLPHVSDHECLSPSHSKSSLNWLIYGHKGWIGQLVIQYIKQLYPHHTISLGQTRVNDKNSLIKELTAINPDRVLSFVGRTYGEGCNTIDFLEQSGKLPINLQDNLVGPLNLLFCCKELNIHLTYMGTGCIFEYDEQHRVPNTSIVEAKIVGFNEDDKPNFFGSSYSIVKGVTDTLFQNYGESNCLNVRIRMPITEDLNNSRNFITKILKYSKICSIENSMTVLPELLPVMLKMSMAKETGTINLTNPGTISHNRILQLYREILNPSFTWENFTIEEQNSILAAKRSNNYLSTDKLEKFAPNVLTIEESIKQLLTSIKFREISTRMKV